MLQRIVAAALIAGLLLSAPLWTASRLYPLTPVLPLWSDALDGVFYAGLLAAAAGVVLMPRPRAWTAAALALAALLALGDWSRWQPWFYQYCVMLAVLAFARADAAPTCRILIACIYFWSGLQKWNPNFRYDTLPWMLEPLGGAVSRFAGRHLDFIGFTAAALESAIGLGLLLRPTRRAAALAACGMHVFILTSIGPFGHRSNEVVWPWNLAMIASVLLLFWREPGERRPGGAMRATVVVLFGFAPALSFLGAWDHYLSFALYSGNPNIATIYLADKAADRLPDLQRYVNENDSGIDDLPLHDWSYGELNVPAYPELRVFRAAGRRVCELAGSPAEMVLIVQEKVTLLGRRRQWAYDCAALAKR